ncbi:LysR family transcriptional regulator [Brevibacillus fluminis]|uniref:LysR family transcriptional regulator n=1 Tax=Brevibacillus fluminis TaxID=511487 RepID=A0A3M8DN73_9BACL|nr:LysR family transcriptional regulator [Brevibacillus fluminis]RNB89526.1 LysR family transcriptional regulator [Brevibacillus fluminis]
MTITQFQVFATIVETGSFTKAGEALNMTQSAVSHALAALEAELGITLLIRDKRQGLLLSDIGKSFLIHIREILSRYEQIKQEAAQASGLEIGTIRIGSFPSASMHLLPKMLGVFHSQHPNVEVVLFEGTFQEVTEWLTSRIVDIGFLSLPHADLDTIPLTQDQMMVVLPLDHRLRDNESIRLAELADEPFIMTKAGSEVLITNMFREANISPAIRFHVQDGGTLLHMVQEGLGITIAPDLSLPRTPLALHKKSLNPPVWRQLSLACPSFRDASPAVKAFVQVAKTLYPHENHTK